MWEGRAKFEQVHTGHMDPPCAQTDMTEDITTSLP